MPALPVPALCVHSFPPVELTEGDLLHAHLLEEAFQEASCRRTEAGLEDDGRPGEGRSTDGWAWIVQETPEDLDAVAARGSRPVGGIWSELDPGPPGLARRFRRGARGGAGAARRPGLLPSLFGSQHFRRIQGCDAPCR